MAGILARHIHNLSVANKVISTTVLRMSFSSNRLVLQPDSQSGISHYGFILGYKIECFSERFIVVYACILMSKVNYFSCLANELEFWGLPLFEGQVLLAFLMDFRLFSIFGKAKDSGTPCHV